MKISEEFKKRGIWIGDCIFYKMTEFEYRGKKFSCEDKNPFYEFREITDDAQIYYMKIRSESVNEAILKFTEIEGDLNV
jgi:hypothetical protein